MKAEIYQGRYEAYLAAIEPYLEAALIGRTESLRQAMAYSLLSGGKRLRPVLCLASCELNGGTVEQALPFAAAVEMIHAYSLIHDDLPCMDDDDLRRGRPSNHKQFGEAAAVLAGDGLQSLAYETMLEVPHSPEAWAAAREIARGAGTLGMVAGQALDIAHTGNEISLERLKEIHLHKTGALILASCLAGAHIANAQETNKQALWRYARALGLAFQIADDVLDAISTPEELGKTPGKDEQEHKTTYVSLFGAEGAQLLAEQAAQEAVAALSEYGEEADFLRITAKNAANRRK